MRRAYLGCLLGEDSLDEGIECPDQFYKYRSLEGSALAFVERTICHSELYFSTPSSFNDPFDCHPTFVLEGNEDEISQVYARVLQRRNGDWTLDRCLQEARRLAKNPVMSPESQEARSFMQQRHVDCIKNKIGVLCLSTNPNSMLMWAHYADSHRGICLQFDGYFEYFAEAQKVDYPPTRVPINPFRDEQIQAMEKALLNKAEDWKYENEWRIVEPRGPGVREFPPDSLTGVILGARISAQHEVLIRQWANQRPSSPKLYRARPCSETFSIHIEEVN